MTIVLSLGAGVQSTAIALMSIDGILPKIDCAIFADTQWEPKGVYEHLARLTAELETAGVPVHVVTAGNLRADSLVNGRFAAMPLHMKGPKGNGMGRRQCTKEYKLDPIKRKVRLMLGAEPFTTKAGVASAGRLKGRPGSKFVEMWVGISIDEIERQKPSDVKYIRRVDPLLDIVQWSREDCLDYLADRWPFPVERSACIGCPYHSNAEWRHQRDNDPEAFADAVDFDAAIRANGLGTFKDEAYVHEARVPLPEVNLDRTTRAERKAAQGRLVLGCNPWSCRSEVPA